MFNKTLLALTGAAILASGDASAYNLISCTTDNGETTTTTWSSGIYDVFIGKTQFPPDSPSRDALAWVETQLFVQSSNLWYKFSDDDDPSVALGNGESELWWADLDPGVLGAMSWRTNYDDCTFKEADVRLSNKYSFDHSASKSALTAYGGSKYPFQAVALHEFGHGGGLDHTANVYSVMGEAYKHLNTNGPTALAFFGEDATAGLIARYGVWDVYDDLGVTHWRWTGSYYGEYSTHGRTRLLDCSTGKPLATFTTSPEPVYKVNKGQCVKLELTYENMGKTSPLSTQVGYYLSTDDTITTLDTFLKTKSFTLYRDTVDTKTTNLTVPSNLTSGKNYWVGAIVDYTNALAEINENNNATYLGIRVN